MTGTEFALALVVAAWCLWWICRDAHDEKRERLYERHVREALANTDETPRRLDLTDRREGFERTADEIRRLPEAGA